MLCGRYEWTDEDRAFYTKLFTTESFADFLGSYNEPHLAAFHRMCAALHGGFHRWRHPDLRMPERQLRPFRVLHVPCPGNHSLKRVMDEDMEAQGGEQANTVRRLPSKMSIATWDSVMSDRVVEQDATCMHGAPLPPWHVALSLLLRHNVVLPPLRLSRFPVCAYGQAALAVQVLSLTYPACPCVWPSPPQKPRRWLQLDAADVLELDDADVLHPLPEHVAVEPHLNRAMSGLSWANSSGALVPAPDVNISPRPANGNDPTSAAAGVTAHPDKQAHAAGDTSGIIVGIDTPLRRVMSSKSAHSATSDGGDASPRPDFLAAAFGDVSSPQQGTTAAEGWGGDGADAAMADRTPSLARMRQLAPTALNTRRHHVHGGSSGTGSGSGGLLDGAGGVTPGNGTPSVFIKAKRHARSAITPAPRHIQSSKHGGDSSRQHGGTPASTGGHGTVTHGADAMLAGAPDAVATAAGAFLEPGSGSPAVTSHAPGVAGAHDYPSPSEAAAAAASVVDAITGGDGAAHRASAQPHEAAALPAPDAGASDSVMAGGGVCLDVVTPPRPPALRSGIVSRLSMTSQDSGAVSLRSTDLNDEAFLKPTPSDAQSRPAASHVGSAASVRPSPGRSSVGTSGDEATEAEIVGVGTLVAFSKADQRRVQGALECVFLGDSVPRSVAQVRQHATPFPWATVRS